MNLKEIFSKMAIGLYEIRTRSAGLSMQQRRVLILVGGHNDVRELMRLSLDKNAIAVLVSPGTDSFIKVSRVRVQRFQRRTTRWLTNRRSHLD